MLIIASQLTKPARRILIELSQQFWFDAAHTLNRDYDTKGSARIHGHSFRAEITVRGQLDRRTGMVVDFGFLEREIAAVREVLDHRFLDEIEDLGPPTMENLCIWIWQRLANKVPNLCKVSIYRDSVLQRCDYFGPDSQPSKP